MLKLITLWIAGIGGLGLGFLLIKFARSKSSIKRLIYSSLFVEGCLLMFLSFQLVKERNSLEDIRINQLRDKIVINTRPALKNLYIMMSLERLYSDIDLEIDKLRVKNVHYAREEGDINKKIAEYIDIEHVIVNDTELNGYDIELNYLSHNKKSEDIKLVTILDTDRYINDVVEYYSGFNQDMKRPSARMSNGVMEILDEGKEGKELDVEDLIQKTKECLADYDKKDELLGDILVIYHNIEVEPSLDSIRAINTKVSTFSTGYSSSGSSRKTNIAVATNNINGTLVAPGEIVSVDKMIKSRVAANGYQKAGSYQNGRTVQTYGGGVCQVSSTLYGACLRAGLIPIERNAHSMAVSYVPLGLDAAISEGVKDLKIKNTYDTPIYITGVANGSTVTFNIYGKEGLLEGFNYQPASSSSKNGLWANSWLNKMKDGVVVEKLDLFESSYRPHG